MFLSGSNGGFRIFSLSAGRHNKEGEILNKE